MHFDYRKARYGPDRDAIILGYCSGRKVLHVGACDSPYTQEKLAAGLLLHTRITEVAEECLGIDIDPEAVGWLAERGIDNVEVRDVSSLREIGFAAEIVVLGETLEHLKDPGSCLESLQASMSRGARLIVSTPNCLGLWLVSQAARNFESIHDDHRVGFTLGLLHQLLAASGLEVEEFYFTFLPRACTLWWQRLWRALSRFRPGLAETLCAVCARRPVSAAGGQGQARPAP